MNVENANATHLMLENVANFLTVTKDYVAVLKCPTVAEKGKKLALVIQICKLIFVKFLKIKICN